MNKYIVNFYLIILNYLLKKNLKFKDYNSELLLRILNKTSVETKKNVDKELFVDEN